MKKLSFSLLVLAAILIFVQCKKEETPTVLPDNVSGLIATAGDGEVTLSWTAPRASNIKDYSISYEPGGTVFNETQSPVIISNLANGIEYTFTVKTRDTDGNLSSGATITATPMGEDGENIKPFIGNVALLSQADLDAWDPYVTYIQGNLDIEGEDITNLMPLSNIDSIVGKLKITFCTSLETLEGLNNLKRTSSTFLLWGNSALTDISALSNLEEVGRDIGILFNDELENLDGLDNLKTVATDVYIGEQGWKSPPEPGPNPKLIDFCGLTTLAQSNNIGSGVFIANNAYNPTIDQIASGECKGDGSLPQDVYGFMAMGGNAQIKVFWELPPDESIVAFEISHTPDDMTYEVAGDQTSYIIENVVNGTEYTITIKSKNSAGQTSPGVSVQSIPGSVTYEGNLQLASQADVDAFDQSYTKINGKLQIIGEDITDLSALSNIDTIFGKLEILQNTALENLNGLQVVYVGSNVVLSDNEKLSDVTALTTLTHIGKDFAVLGNLELENLNGFENVTTIVRDIHIGIEGWQNPPIEHGNPKLSDFCALKNVFKNGTHGGTYNVDFNKENPTKDDIISCE